jgi:hypothetical protein
MTERKLKHVSRKFETYFTFESTLQGIPPNNDYMYLIFVNGHMCEFAVALKAKYSLLNEYNFKIRRRVRQCC